MLIKNFQADSMREAMKKIKDELGTDAVILNTQVVEEKGVRGTVNRKRFEITAGKDVPVNTRVTPAVASPPANASLKSEEKKQIADFSLLIRRFEKEINYLVHSQKEIRALLRTPLEARPFCHYLEMHDLEKDLISRLFERDRAAAPGNPPDLEALRLRLLELCAKTQPIKTFASGTNKVAFVGPPASGKSSLLAKIASTLVLKKKIKTTLVNLDDYKPSAGADLATYAELLNVPYHDRAGWEEQSETSDFNIVLADTSSIPIGDRTDLENLKVRLDNFAADEIHLVIPAYCLWREVSRWLDFFDPIAPSQLAVTFLDQTESFGLPFNLAAHRSLRLSYFSWGRHKISNLEEANLYALSNKLLEKVEEFDVQFS